MHIQLCIISGMEWSTGIEYWNDPNCTNSLTIILSTFEQTLVSHHVPPCNLCKSYSSHLISVLPLVYKCTIYRFDDQETHSEYCIVDILGRVFVLDVSKNLTATKIKSTSCN